MARRLLAVTDSSQLFDTPPGYWAASTSMDLSAPTEELGPIGEAPPAEAPTAELHTAPLRSARERCAACGAALASDQRYCVECGQRLGSARLPFMDDPARHAARSAAQPPAKMRMSVNSTLIAGVGTLLLAMGIGILIGRSSPGSSATRATPVQVVSVPGTGAAGAASATEAQGALTGASPASSGSSSAKSTKASAKVSKPKLPPAKVVTVGSPGKGRGYQKGHFTGNFFGEGEK
jgi:hypothetical protein